MSPSGRSPRGRTVQQRWLPGRHPSGRRCTERGENRPSESHPLQAPLHRLLQSPPSDICNGFLQSSQPRSDSPLLGRPRLPPGVMTSSRPPPAPGLARPRHPAASSEKSGAELAPRLARGDSAAWAPGPGNRDKQAGRRGGGGRAGAWPRAGHPGSGARRRPRREREGSAAALEPGYSREASRARAGGLWRRRVAGPALAAGPGAWRSVGGVALGGCQVGGRGKSGSTVPRGGEAGRTRGPGKVPSPSCPPSSVPGLAWPGRRPGPRWTAAWPHPHPGSLPLYSAPRLLPQDSQTPPRDRARLLHFDPIHTPHPRDPRPHQVTP